MWCWDRMTLSISDLPNLKILHTALVFNRMLATSLKKDEGKTLTRLNKQPGCLLFVQPQGFPLKVLVSHRLTGWVSAHCNLCNSRVMNQIPGSICFPCHLIHLNYWWTSFILCFIEQISEIQHKTLNKHCQSQLVFPFPFRKVIKKGVK